MKRIPIIDFVRFGSILMVITGHFFPRWIIHSIPSAVIQQAIMNVFLNGPRGVTCFFVVSGFLITQMLAENKSDFSKINFRSFYVKRAARILPLLFAAVIVFCLLRRFQTFLYSDIASFHVWDEATDFSWKFWLSLVTFNFNWYVIMYFVGASLQWQLFWSLAVEEQFYFFYPFVIKTLRHRKNVFIFLIGVVLFAVIFRGLAYFYLNPNKPWMQLSSFSAFDQIAIGGILFFINEKFGYWFKARPKISLVVMLLGIISCFYTCYSTLTTDRFQLIYVPTLVAAGCAFVILGGLHVSFLFSRIAHILSWPGKLSYGSYLIHVTIMFLLLPYLYRLGGVLGLMFLVAVVTFAAFLSYRFFEVPVNHWIRSRFNLNPSSSE